jgi:hypothetical protein
MRRASLCRRRPSPPAWHRTCLEIPVHNSALGFPSLLGKVEVSFGQLFLVHAVTVRKCPGLRHDAQRSLLFAHFVPDLALVRAMTLLQSQRPRDGAFQGITEVVRRNHPAGGKDSTRSPPSTLLDARYRNRELSASWHQDGRVQDSVLLGSTKLLAFEKQSSPITFVFHEQVGDAALLGDLFDRDRTRFHCFVGEQVIDGAVDLAEQREDRQRAMVEREENNRSKAICEVLGTPPGRVTLVPLARGWP